MEKLSKPQKRLLANLNRGETYNLDGLASKADVPNGPAARIANCLTEKGLLVASKAGWRMSAKGAAAADRATCF